MLEGSTPRPEPELNEEIKDFILANFKSIASLEALLCLRTHGAEGMTANDLSNELRSNPEYAENILQELYVKNFLQRSGLDGSAKYIYQPENQKILDFVTSICILYQLKRVTIINLIYNSSLEKIRTFAGAFKLRK